MIYMTEKPTAEGQYFLRRIECAHPPKGFFLWPDSLDRAAFEQYEGFVKPEIFRGVVVRYSADTEAYSKWKAAQVPPESTDTEVLNALLGVSK